MATEFSAGLGAATQFRDLQRIKEKQAFEIQQTQVANFDKIVTDAESSLKQLNKQFAIKRAAAPTGEDQARIDLQYQQAFESVIKPISRAGELANQSGVPIDLPVALSRFVPLRQLADLNAQALVDAQTKGQAKLAEETGKLTAQAQTLPLEGAQFFQDESGQAIAITPAGQQVPLGPLQRLPAKQQIETRELTTKAQGAVETGLISGGERMARLKSIQQRFKPEFLQIPTRLKASVLRGVEKLGVDLSQEDRQFVTDISNFFGDALFNINRTIQEFTGAQLSQFEANRLRQPEPDPGESIFQGQSPSQFKANLDRAILDVQMSQARMTKLLNDGLINEADIANKTAGDKAASLISLDEMLQTYDSRGEEIFNQLKRDNPQLPDDQAFSQAKQLLDQEFGL